MARRFSPRAAVDEDLLSVATIALVVAAQRFDPDRGVAFHSFAVPTISGEIKRFLRDQTWSAHVPRRLKELSLRIDKAQRVGEQERGRSLTVQELAERLEVDPEAIVEALEAAESRRSGSLATFDRASDRSSWEQIATVISVDRALDDLSEQERTALLLRYVADLTQTQIGDQLGCSQPHVHRLLTRSVEKLQRHFDLVPASQ